MADTIRTTFTTTPQPEDLVQAPTTFERIGNSNLYITDRYTGTPQLAIFEKWGGDTTPILVDLTPNDMLDLVNQTTAYIKSNATFS